MNICNYTNIGSIMTNNIMDYSKCSLKETLDSGFTMCYESVKGALKTANKLMLLFLENKPFFIEEEEE